MHAQYQGARCNTRLNMTSLNPQHSVIQHSAFCNLDIEYINLQVVASRCILKGRKTAGFMHHCFQVTASLSRSIWYCKAILITRLGTLICALLCTGFGQLVLGLAIYAVACQPAVSISILIEGSCACLSARRVACQLQIWPCSFAA